MERHANPLGGFMDFQSVLTSLRERLAWRDSDEPAGVRRRRGKARVFVVPPTWWGSFYRQVLAEASAQVYLVRDREGVGFARVSISSIDDTYIHLEGPHEQEDHAEARLKKLMKRLQGVYIPSREELSSIAAECGCTQDFN